MAKSKRMDSRHKTKAAAEARARRLRAQGKEARVRKDPLTGEWIVDLFVLVVTLGLLGALLRRPA